MHKPPCGRVTVGHFPTVIDRVCNLSATVDSDRVADKLQTILIGLQTSCRHATVTSDPKRTRIAPHRTARIACHSSHARQRWNTTYTHIALARITPTVHAPVTLGFGAKYSTPPPHTAAPTHRRVTAARAEVRTHAHRHRQPPNACSNDLHGGNASTRPSGHYHIGSSS